jgi:hypothetical protein
MEESLEKSDSTLYINTRHPNGVYTCSLRTYDRAGKVLTDQTGYVHESAIVPAIMADLRFALEQLVAKREEMRGQFNALDVFNRNNYSRAINEEADRFYRELIKY